MRKIFAFFLLTWVVNLFAVDPRIRIASLSNALQKNIEVSSTYDLECKDDWYDYIIGNQSGQYAWSTIFAINNTRSNVVLRFDETKRIYHISPWSMTISYDLITYDATGAATNYTGTESVTIDYDPVNNFKDIDIKSYPNSLYAQLKVTGVTLTVNGAPVAWGPAQFAKYQDVYLDIEQRSEFCFIADAVDPLKLKFADGFNSSAPANNELSLAWNNLEWAQSYDLEWVFVDVPTGTINPSAIIPNWKNATRINTPFNFYNISLAYPRGAIFMRVRGIGLDQSDCVTRLEGYWDTDVEMFSNPQPDIDYSFIWNGLDPKFNWQYSASYAEDGKRKEVINYFDGSLKSRQTTTVLNTEKNVLIGEVKYDYEGRPAVEMMPTPLQYSGIKYYSNFNTSYDRTNFDLDSKLTSPDPVPGGSNSPFISSLTNAYYSDHNPQTGINSAYIPDAENYPYARTTFLSDGTNRVKSQSGVGVTFKAGGGRETRYLYANPSSQDELDRLFGNEVGNVLHYQKNYLIDANGQASVQYLDQEGRVIATALAGPAPSNLLPIDDPDQLTVPEIVTEDILTGKNNFDANGDLVDITTVPIITPASEYTFYYTLGTHCTEIKCEDNITVINNCEECIYQLEFLVTDENGQTVSMSDISVNPNTTPCQTAANPFVCDNIQNGTYAFTVTFNNVGVYKVIKRLKISPTNLAVLEANYLIDQQVLAPENRCVHFPPIIPEPCGNDCNSMCEEPYIRRNNQGDIIVDNNNDPVYYNNDGTVAQGTDLTAIQTAIADCQADCGSTPSNVLTECELKLLMLKKDLDPEAAGQYFLNTPAQYDNMGNLNPNYDWKKWLNSFVMDDHALTFPSPYTSFETWFEGEICNCTNSSVQYSNWDDVRNNWNPVWLDELVLFHPEYCRYTYNCLSTFCTDGSVTMASSNTFDETLRGRLSQTDLANMTAGYFFPHLNSFPNATSTSNGFNCVNDNYVPSTFTVSSSLSTDPLMSSAGSCAMSFSACTNNPSGSSLFQQYLQNFVTFTNPSPPCSTVVYNIWYVLEDPDNIHGNATTPSYTASIPTGIIEMFKQLHGDPNDQTNYPGLFNIPTGQTSPPMTKYAYFLSVYQFFKQHLIYKNYNTWASTHSCTTAWLDNDGTNDGQYTATFNDQSTGQFQVRYPQIEAYEMMNVCDIGSTAMATTFSTSIGSDPMADQCTATCESYADNWMSKLTLCNLNGAIYNNVRQYLIDICSANCDAANPLGNSGCATCTTFVCTNCTTACGVSTGNLQTFQDVIDFFTCGACDIIPLHPLTSDEQTGDCICNNLSAILDDHSDPVTSDPYLTTSNPSGIATYLNSIYGTSVTSSDVTSWLQLCGQVAATGTVTLPPDKDAFGTLNLPPVLDCTPPAVVTYNPGSCSCENLSYFFASLGLDKSNGTHQTAVANHINDWLGLSGANAITGTNVANWLTECASTNPLPSVTDLQAEKFPTQFSCPAIASPGTQQEIDLAHSASICFKENLQEAIVNSATSYLQDLEETKYDYISKYIAGCKATLVGNPSANPPVAPKETFTMTYERHEYWYTLYYYDQAGNLIKTVAPEGVEFLINGPPPFNYLTQVKNYRAGLQGSTFTVPPHEFVTQYKYNSLQSAIESSSPDGGTSKFFYDNLGRNVISQNAKQLANSITNSNIYSYAEYDELGRSYEAGELINSATIDQTTAGNKSNFQIWMTQTIARTQVVYTYYDEAIPGSGSNDYVTGGQKNLRNRVSSTTYEETKDGNPLTFDNASHYTYDIHGNVNTLVQQNNQLSALNHHKKRIDYEYDLISGNVNKVSYQDGEADRFYHKYYYDADNRLKVALSSHDNMIWERESKSFYYSHGPLARQEIGDKQVAGNDYAYTLQGWIKGVNSNTLVRSRDIGIDGTQEGLNDNFAVDAYGYTLGYFIGDYIAVGAGTTARQFEAANPIGVGYSFGNSIKSLYNGNISHMVSTQLKTDETQLDILGNVYQYDQLNRIKQADRYTDQTNLKNNNAWSTGASHNNNKYKEYFEFDFNGNIKKVQRNGHNSGSTAQMDDISYYYKTISGKKTNMLAYVSDLSSLSSNYSDDIDAGQLTNNYDYDAIGNLKQDLSEEINMIEWTVSGKIKSITRTPASTKSDLEFTYDATGNRICKLEKKRNSSGGYQPSSRWIYTYYVRDAVGNILSIYTRHPNELDLPKLFLSEQNIYASTQIGQYKPEFNIEDATTPPTTGTIAYSLTRGFKVYTGSNHLGNVLVTVSDRKLAIDDLHYITPGSDYVFRLLENEYKYTPGAGIYTPITGGDGLVDHYLPDVISSSDYYVYGAMMGDRNFSSFMYRNGFNGQEKDNEIAGDGNIMSAEFWEYDARLGRRWNLDPLIKFHESSYASFANNPIWFADPSGADTITFTTHSITYKNKNKNNGNTGVTPSTGNAKYSIEVRAGGPDVFYRQILSTVINEETGELVTTRTFFRRFYPDERSYSGITTTEYAWGFLERQDDDMTSLARLAPKELLQYMYDKTGDWLYKKALIRKKDYFVFEICKGVVEVAYSAYIQGVLIRGVIGAASKLTLTSSAAEIEVNEATIMKALEGSQMKTMQDAVSLPAIKRYVKRALSGEEAPAIKVADGVIIDGNHRYIAYRILGLEPKTVPGVISPSQASKIKSIKQIKVDKADWGND